MYGSMGELKYGHVLINVGINIWICFNKMYGSMWGINVWICLDQCFDLNSEGLILAPDDDESPGLRSGPFNGHLHDLRRHLGACSSRVFRSNFFSTSF